MAFFVLFFYLYKYILLMLDFLPVEIAYPLAFIEKDKLFGLRLRIGYPIIVYCNKGEGYLSKNGFSSYKEPSIICNEKHIDYILKMVTEHSLYAFNEQIKNGFITTEKGVRIGLSGECVFDNDKILTLKNITSMNIRIPHFISGCAKNVLPYIITDRTILDTLIISPPFCGKTTFLKDIAFHINNTLSKSIMIIDERGEFSEVSGINIDKIKYSDKLYAFDYGIRSLSPDIVITDELSSSSDWECVKKAKNSGVNIIASCHAENITDLQDKDFFKFNLFLRYIVLKNYRKEGAFGQVSKIYDGGFNEI